MSVTIFPKSAKGIKRDLRKQYFENAGRGGTAPATAGNLALTSDQLREELVAPEKMAQAIIEGMGNI